MRLQAAVRDAPGLSVRVQRFSTPRGRSRNVIGVRRGRPLPARGHGAQRHGAAVARRGGQRVRPRRCWPRSRRGSAEIDPPCTVWLVATGAEERIYTGSPDHLGALALPKIVPRRRLRYALSLDEVGRGTQFRLRSPAARPRTRVERELLGRRGHSTGSATTATGNSDHREFELAGMRGVKLGVLDNPCRHRACDTPGRLQRRLRACAAGGRDVLGR